MFRRGICRSGLQSVASRSAALCMADNTLSCEFRRPHNGQVSELAEVNHFMDPQKAADMSKLSDRWIVDCNDFGVWVDTTTWVHQRESAGVDPSGHVQKTCDGSREH